MKHRNILVAAVLVGAWSTPALAKNPVLLIHGIDDDRSKMATLKGYLEARGLICDSFDLVPSDGTVGLEGLADQLAVRADDFLAKTKASKLDLVGFSLGGIVARTYLRKEPSRVGRLVTISSPHHGTWTAFLRWNQLGQELRPNSPFLTSLNQKPPENHTVLWTPFDLMIVPASSSRLQGAKEIKFPVLLHPWMVSDGRVLRAIAESLESVAEENEENKE